MMIKNRSNWIEPAKDGKQRPPRKRALLSGRVVFRNGDQSFECAILNVSDRGARIRTSRHAVVPRSFYLIEMTKALAHAATVRWVQAPVWGVMFERSFVLDEALPVELDFLRMLVELDATRRSAASQRP